MSNWIFQANPARYDVQSYVSEFRYIYWSVGQSRFKQLPNVGDEVFIWKSYGKPRDFAGVVAHGFIIEPPTEKQNVQHPKHLGDNHWRGIGKEISTVKVGINLDDVRPSLNKGALRRERLVADDILSKSQIIKVRSGALFRLNEEQVIRLRELWATSE